MGGYRVENDSAYNVYDIIGHYIRLNSIYRRLGHNFKVFSYLCKTQLLLLYPFIEIKQLKYFFSM